MSKITTDHLCRAAYVYVRQSTMGQVHHNLESQKRQYGLERRARQFGWQTVITVDEDLGRSGSGVTRPGFDRLMTAVSRGEVGAVFAIEASRLARNGRDWHKLLEFCAVVGTLIIDEEEVYDPRRGTDQMVLGLKGAFSAMETSAIHQRSQEALGQMAQRGALFRAIAAGYVVGPAGRLVKDPDIRVQEALALLFQRFRELGCARQVVLSLHRQGLSMPTRASVDGRWQVVWKLPNYGWVKNALDNPVYAGAYAYGRQAREVRLIDGRRVYRSVRRPREQWKVLLHDQHDGYIDWDEYERNRQTLADNTTRKGQEVRGAVRNGAALLAGLLRCNLCGRRLAVHHQASDPNRISYVCRRPAEEGGVTACCIHIAARYLDRPVSDALLRVMAPFGIGAALTAIDTDRDRDHGRCRQSELALEAARYQAGLARRQYDAVDPDNRLVAGQLERRWNEQLAAVQQLEAQVTAQTEEASANRLTPAERERLIALGQDLPAAWHHPAASVELKKRILRTAIHEIMVRVEGDQLTLFIHWQGGDHTALDIARKVRGNWRDPKLADAQPQILAAITQLARMIPDSSIAAVLNRLGHRTIGGLSWTAARVENFRCKNNIPAYRPGERAERGELMLDDVMQELGLSKMTVIRMIHAGKLPARQIFPGAPYIIRREDIDAPTVRHPRQERPVSADQQQLTLELQ